MATKRVTADDVKAVYGTFTERAVSVGFNTNGWTLTPPGSVGMMWNLWEVVEDSGTHYYTTQFPSHIASTNREAYETIAAWVRALDAVIILNRQNGSN